MSELQVWVLLCGVLALAGGWLAFVAWLRVQALRIRREPTRVQISDLGAHAPGEGDEPDWVAAEKEAMLRAQKNIRKLRTGESI